MISDGGGGGGGVCVCGGGGYSMACHQSRVAPAINSNSQVFRAYGGLVV